MSRIAWAEKKSANALAKNNAMTEKVCTSCNELLPISCFRRRKNKARSWVSACSPCRRQWDRDKAEEVRNDPELKAAKVAAIRSARLVREYGITAEEYDKMWQEQGGRCLICGGEETCKNVSVWGDEKVRALAVDHCHDTGKVRGLLCKNCNTLIGFAKEDVELLRSAISYLEELS